MENKMDDFGAGFDNKVGKFLIQDTKTKEFYYDSIYENQDDLKKTFRFTPDSTLGHLFTEYQIHFWGEVNDLKKATGRDLQAISLRALVYDAIDSERDYQDTRWAGHKHEVAGYITMLGHYHNELLAAWTKSSGDGEALNVIRKIAGICTHAMEVHGAPLRVVKQEVCGL